MKGRKKRVKKPNFLTLKFSKKIVGNSFSSNVTQLFHITEGKKIFELDRRFSNEYEISNLRKFFFWRNGVEKKNSNS